MKQCRFSLDDQHLDKGLCIEIEKIRNGGSWNEATRLYLRILFHQRDRRDVTPERQDTYGECTDNDNELGESKINLSGLDAIFLEAGE